MTMIDPKICRKVLSVGPITSKGGISAVLTSYAQIFKPFDCVSTYSDSSLAGKVWKAFYSCAQVVYYCSVGGKKIVHLHSASYRSFQRKRLLAALARMCGAKTIFHIHNGEFDIFAKKFGVAKTKKILAKNAAVIALSDYWKKKLEDTLGIGNVTVINNIVMAPQGTSRHEAKEKINLLFLGIICDDKGIFDLLDVLAADKEFYQKHVNLTIGGKGETEKLEKFIQKYSLQNFVHFTGWVNGDEKSQLIRDSDIYILPSYHEGVPISILEAMSYGNAIISTSVGGIPGIVQNGGNGYLISPGNKKELDEKLRTLINNRGELEKMGASSLELVRPYLDFSVAIKLEELYKKYL